MENWKGRRKEGKEETEEVNEVQVGLDGKRKEWEEGRDWEGK
jgi:hypothetical protein